MKRVETIGFEIKTISNLIKRKINESPFEFDDLTGMQGWILKYVHIQSQYGNVFQKDIEKEFKIRRSTATGILQLLEKNSYITRESVVEDARLKKIVLTEKAIRAQEELTKRVEKLDNLIERGLTDEELEIFFKIAKKIKKNLE